MKRLFIVVIIVYCLLGNFVDNSGAQQKKVRKPYVAGQFYPGTKAQLITQIQQYLDLAEKTELAGPLRALAAPHAGYIYSGATAAYAYKHIEKPFKRVFIFASNHSSYADVNGLSVPDYTHYNTPLGEVSVSPLVRDLEKEDRISFVPAAHTTHIVEVHLPFLQMVMDDFEIIPVVTGRMNPDDVKRFGELFNKYVDDDTLFIVSTDLSHYHPYDEAVNLDTSCIHALENLDTGGVIDSELCGQGAALILLEIAKKRGWKGKILDYRNSGDTAGDKARVVGYAAIAYYEPPLSSSLETDKLADTLSEEEQQMLLELAEKTLELYIKEKKVYTPDFKQFSSYPKLTERRGAFVTLKQDDLLRGCIGSIIGRQPLYLCVRDNAISAALRDFRFSPVTEDELGEIDLSISVLDVPALLQVNDPEQYLEKLTHQDGVILICDRHSSTYLPQVWEQLPDTAEFLSRLCVKGGSEPNCWRNPSTQIYTYRAQEFGEK